MAAAHARLRHQQTALSFPDHCRAGKSGRGTDEVRSAAGNAQGRAAAAGQHRTEETLMKKFLAWLARPDVQFCWCASFSAAFAATAVVAPSALAAAIGWWMSG